MQSVESLYFGFGDVRSKMDNADRLYRDHAARIGADRHIQDSLSRLVQLGDDVSEAMRCMGMFELCAECGDQPGGGCCSAMMADEADAMLLLINLSAGFEVGPKRDDGYECCFLGPMGCSLKFKPFFCLNYLCGQIQVDSSPEDLARLQRATAAFLSQLVTVEELIRQQLSAA